VWGGSAELAGLRPHASLCRLGAAGTKPVLLLGHGQGVRGEAAVSVRIGRGRLLRPLWLVRRGVGGGVGGVGVFGCGGVVGGGGVCVVGGQRAAIRTVSSAIGGGAWGGWAGWVGGGVGGLGSAAFRRFGGGCWFLHWTTRARGGLLGVGGGGVGVVVCWCWRVGAGRGLARKLDASVWGMARPMRRVSCLRVFAESARGAGRFASDGPIEHALRSQHPFRARSNLLIRVESRTHVASASSRAPIRAFLNDSAPVCRRARIRVCLDPRRKASKPARGRLSTGSPFPGLACAAHARYRVWP